MSPVVVLCSGSRDWSAPGVIFERLERLVVPSPMTPIKVRVGDARGADAEVREACAALGLSCEVFIADWAGLGRIAGIARNVRMLASDPRPSLLLAFHRGTSRGTKHMIEATKNEGVPIEIHWRPS